MSENPGLESRLQAASRRNRLKTGLQTRLGAVPTLFQTRSHGEKGFTLVESLVASALTGIVFVTLYAGMTSGFKSILVSRENLRATQILQEKFETIRLFNWDQINSNGFIPATFAVALYPDSAGQSNAQMYQGSISISNSFFTEIYSNDILLVTVQLSWTNGSMNHTRQMSSFVARYGLQNYIY